jgi:hypothetical protein
VCTRACLDEVVEEKNSQPLQGLEPPDYPVRSAALGIFLLTTACRPALGPTQPPIQWVPRALSLRVKRQER